MTSSDFRQQPLQGAALYNPHLHGKNELLSLFVVRQALLDQLLEDLRATDAGKSPQHHLILGQRGMGKTMLLRRLGYAIEDDAVLRDRWLPLNFPEEQYNIAHLSDFWLNCIDSLSDLLETQGRHDMAEDLDDRAAALRSSGEEQRSRQALGLLVGAARKLGRRLVLLVDNVDLIFERVREQEWALREVLSSEPALVMIGASANAVESSFAYDQAFYDFFRVHELEGLSFEETCEFLLRYAEIWGTAEVKRVAEQEMGRIKVLHTLTGGNPRTLVLLFNVLAVGAEGDVRTDLERLLDQSTPLYKARLEAHSTQAQQIIHGMAVRWDPVSAGELAKDLGWEVNAVSAQLNRLFKQGTVEKVAYDPESKTGFQIAERFFNIWYLMRASRRLRRRLIWLVEFLKVFYSQDELRAKATLHIRPILNLSAFERIRYAEYSFALADAMTDQVWRSSLEKSGVYAIVRDHSLHGRLTEFVDLEENSPSLRDGIALQGRLEESRCAVTSFSVDLPGWSGEDFWAKLKETLLLSLDEKVWLAENISKFDNARLTGLKSDFDSESKVLGDKYVCSQSIDDLENAVRSGLMVDPDDVDGAIHAESILGVRGLKAIALANKLELNPDPEYLASLSKEIESTTSPFPWLIWLQLSLTMKEGLSAADLERAIRGVLSRARANESALYALINLLRRHGSYVEAEDVCRRLLEIQPSKARYWVALGHVLWSAGLYDAALQAGEKAAELESSLSSSAFLAVSLLTCGRYTDAERSIRRALESDPSRPELWSGLGVVLSRLRRFDEAESAYRESLKLKPDENTRRLLAGLLVVEKSDFDSAGELAREFLEGDKAAAIILAAVLAHKGDWNGAAESAEEFLSDVSDQDLEEYWHLAFAFWREAVRVGKAREAVEILEKTGAAERWRPVREALEAIARGSESYLRRVAPEVRPAARQLYKELQGPVSVGPADPKRSSSRRRTGRKKP